MKFTPRLLLGALLLAGVSDNAKAAIIADDFEVDSSANYTVVANGTDGVATFGWDYIAAGIPLAPNSTAGDTGGLMLTANTSQEVEEARTAYNNTAVTASKFQLSVDVWMNVNIQSSGTTEFGHVGVAGDGVTVNSLFSPITGSGHFVAFTGEGGSSSDFRHSTPTTLAVPSGDPSYLNSTNTTNATGDTYQAIFTNPPYEFAGSPGNAWATLTITAVAGQKITYAFNGTPIIRTDFDGSDGNLVSLGLGDLFTSIAPPGTQFTVYDNLTVSAIPEPASVGLSLLALAGLAAARRRR
ncbi:MAG: PEP-CTERM sorting domain-containing protein [Planctomycetales bacterium]|nr:PEP-CTERM sorting domain-containing protein [Planctomycetales bacterium]